MSFFGCSGLEFVDIPNSVTSIRHWAFDGCINLKSVTIHEKKPEKAFELIRNALDNIRYNISNITLNVPIGTGYAYRHHPYFAQFKEIVAKVR